MSAMTKRDPLLPDEGASRLPQDDPSELAWTRAGAEGTEYSDSSDQHTRTAHATPVMPRTPRKTRAAHPHKKRIMEQLRLNRTRVRDSNERIDYFEDEQRQRQKLRRKHSSLKRQSQPNQKPAWWPSAKLPRPDVLAALRKAPECPVGRPDEGAPILRMMPAELILCMTDNLCFPEIFALAMTCKSMQQTINLKLAKTKYWTQLTNANASMDALKAAPPINRNQTYTHDVCDVLATELTRLCGACCYALSASYFAKGSAFTHGGLCRDCTEFRSDMEAARKSGFQGKLPYVPWRPSRRVTVPGTGGALWYRKRT